MRPEEEAAPDKRTIWASSAVHQQDRLPYVHIEWGELKAAMSPEEARQFGLRVIACAESAETDAVLVKFFMEQVGLGVMEAVVLLADFRKLRVAQRGTVQ